MQRRRVKFHNHYVVFESLDWSEAGVFEGTFDGAGYTISNLTINEAGEDRVGLFSQISGGTVRDLTLANVAIIGESSVGALAGRSTDGSVIENVHVTSGSITGTDGGDAVGGLVGAVYDGSEFYEVTTNVTVSAPQSDSIGGLIGGAQDVVIEKAAAYGLVTGGERVGGLIGDAWESDLFWVHAKGNVAGADDGIEPWNIGGLIGETENTNVATAYATGNVDGFHKVGGLIGGMVEGGSVAYSYSAGNMTVSSGEGNESGGFVGYIDQWGENIADIDATTFWDTETSEHTWSAGDGEVGKTTAEMKTLATYTDVGFDFEEVPYWGVISEFNNGYPCHTWEDGCGIDEEQSIDDDNDGVSSTVEGAAPNSGDGNNDGTPDGEQAHVASFVNAVTGLYSTVAVNEQCELSAVSSNNANTHSKQDAEYTYKTGFINFTADCGDDGFTTAVTVYNYGVNKDGLVVRKYNPNTQTYFTIEDASLAQQTVGGQTVAVASYSITDGGNLDVDGEENGIIVDPVSLGGIARGAADVQSAGGALASTGQNAALLMLIATTIFSAATLSLYIAHSRKRQYFL